MKKIYAYLFQIITIGLLSAHFHAFNIMHKLPWFIVSTDIVHFYEKVASPGIFYLDKLIEYPILTGLFMQFNELINISNPLLFSHYVQYYFLNAFFLISFAALATFFLYKLYNKHFRNLSIYWIFAPSMFFFLVYNYDILAIFFVVLAIYFNKKNKIIPASISLGLGFCSKFYPIIYLIPLLIKRNNTKERLKIIASFLFTLSIINLPFVLFSFDNWFYFFNFNSIRYPNPDSIWGAVSLFFPQFSIPNINLVSLILFIILYFLVLFKFKQASFSKLGFLVTLAFLLTNKVFSPQYLLWLLPFFVLNYQPKKIIFYALELSNLVVLFTILPLYTIAPQNLNLIAICISFVVVRHILLLCIFLKNVYPYITQPIKKYWLLKPIFKQKTNSTL